MHRTKKEIKRKEVYNPGWWGICVGDLVDLLPKKFNI